MRVLYCSDLVHINVTKISLVILSASCSAQALMLLSASCAATYVQYPLLTLKHYILLMPAAVLQRDEYLRSLAHVLAPAVYIRAH
jgi:hypothetical protein